MNEEQKELLSFLYKKVGKLELGRIETAEILSISVSTLDRLRSKSLGPEYKKNDSKSFNSAVRYPLHCIVKYLTTSNIKTL